MCWIDNVRYYYDWFSQDLKWWNTADLLSYLLNFIIILKREVKCMDCTWIWSLRFSRTVHTTLITFGWGVYRCGFFNVCVWACVCSNNFESVLVICVIVFTVFLFVFLCLFLNVISVRTAATERKLIALNNNNNNNNSTRLYHCQL
jgi:hypothetical protein